MLSFAGIAKTKKSVQLSGTAPLLLNLTDAWPLPPPLLTSLPLPLLTPLPEHEASWIGWIG